MQETIQEVTNRFHEVFRVKGDRMVQRSYMVKADLFVYQAYAPRGDPTNTSPNYTGFREPAHRFPTEYDPKGTHWSTLLERRDGTELEALKLIRELFPETNNDDVGRISGIPIIFAGPRGVPDGQEQRDAASSEKCYFCSIPHAGHDTKLEGHVWRPSWAME